MSLKILSERSPGQSLTEFALVAPIFLLMVFAVLQFGLLLGGQNGLVNAVRDASRYASTVRVQTAADAASACAATTSPLSQLTRNLQGSIPGYQAARVSAPTITYRWQANPDGTYFVQVEVGVNYKFPLYVPLIGNFLNDGSDPFGGQAKTLGATEKMRIENPSLTLTTVPTAVSC